MPAVSEPTSLIDPPLVAAHVSVAPSIAFSNVSIALAESVSVSPATTATPVVDGTTTASAPGPTVIERVVALVPLPASLVATSVTSNVPACS